MGRGVIFRISATTSAERVARPGVHEDRRRRARPAPRWWPRRRRWRRSCREAGSPRAAIAARGRGACAPGLAWAFAVDGASATRGDSSERSTDSFDWDIGHSREIVPEPLRAPKPRACSPKRSLWQRADDRAQALDRRRRSARLRRTRSDPALAGRTAARRRRCATPSVRRSAMQRVARQPHLAQVVLDAHVVQAERRRVAGPAPRRRRSRSRR